MNNKIYTDDVVSKLQEAININGVEVNHFDSWDDLPKVIMLYSAKYTLLPDHTILCYYDESITKENILMLNNSGIKKCYCYDWRHKNDDAIKDYVNIHVSVGEIKVTILAKHVDEIPEDNEYAAYLTANDDNYIIIKCILDDYEHYYQNSELEEQPEMLIHDTFGNLIINGTKVTSKDDDTASKKVSINDLNENDYTEDSIELF